MGEGKVKGSVQQTFGCVNRTSDPDYTCTQIIRVHTAIPIMIYSAKSPYSNLFNLSEYWTLWQTVLSYYKRVHTATITITYDLFGKESKKQQQLIHLFEYWTLWQTVLSYYKRVHTAKKTQILLNKFGNIKKFPYIYGSYLKYGDVWNRQV